MHSSVPAGRRSGIATLTCAVAMLAAACSSNSTTTGVGAPGIITKASVDNTNFTVGQGVGPFVVIVTDTAGNPVPNVPVTYTSSSPNLALLVTAVNTDAEGTASSSGTFNNVAGAYTVTATVAAIPASVVFHTTANPDVPATFLLGGGNNQTAPAGTPDDDILAVRVADQFNNPISGVTVGWVTSKSGVLTSSSTITAASGVAQNTFKPALGSQTVTATATINGTVMTVIFTETGT